MSGASVTSFFLGIVWLILTISAAVFTDVSIGEERHPGREEEAVRGAIMTFIWTVGIVVALGYVAAGVGLTMEQPWGKAMAWIMMPWSLLLVPIGTPIGIYHMIALPKHP